MTPLNHHWCSRRTWGASSPTMKISALPTSCRLFTRMTLRLWLMLSRISLLSPLGFILGRYYTCAIGDAYVRFIVRLNERLDKSFRMGPNYQLQFGKHDEGKNASFQDIDKEVWIMLVSFPSDAKNNTSISKAIAGFGLLCYWHEQ